MRLLDALKWRYAAKQMNGQTVPQEKIDYILETAVLAPSSSGLQPYQIFVISNKKLQQKIKTAGFGQSQITDASHLLVFAAWDCYSLERIEAVFKRMTAARGIPTGALDAYKEKLWSTYKDMGRAWQADHAAKQAYISFGLALAAAAEQEVDAAPMEGFIPAEVDTLLGLDELGLKSVLLLPLGYRDPSKDWLVNLKKIRTPQSDFVTEIK